MLHLSVCLQFLPPVFHQVGGDGRVSKMMMYVVDSWWWMMGDKERKHSRALSQPCCLRLI